MAAGKHGDTRLLLWVHIRWESIEGNEVCAQGFLLMGLSRVFLRLCLSNARLWFWHLSCVWGGGGLVICWQFHCVPRLVNRER